MSIGLESLRELYPFEPHYCDASGGARLHYVDEGAGDPVVMVHGNPTWSFLFRDLIADLRKDRRVVAPDHVGCGLSEKPQDYPYTLGTHVENLGRLIDELELSNVTLLLHDWGVAVGMGWAVDHPERVRRLIVTNGAAFLGEKAPRRILLCRVPLLGDVLLRGFNAFARAALRMATARPERMTPQVRRGYLFPYGNWANRVAILSFVRDIPVTPRVPSHDVLADIEARLPLLRDKPMLILWGERDFCFHERFLQGWKERFPDARVHRFPDAGHYLMEDAGDRLLPLIRDFTAS